MRQRFKINLVQIKIIVISLVIGSLSSCHTGRDESAEALARKATIVNYTPAPERIPIYPYGAVYFRKSNPPKEDWERDYKTASDIGMNIFRHWFMWSVIEIAPGKYDWSDYDKQMDLAEQYGIKTIIAEMSNSAPEWMAPKYPEWLLTGSDNSKAFPSMNGSSATSGVGMCLDNDEFLLAAEKFQRTLIERYRDHPATLGYDLWNEGGMSTCYCEATQEKFREWLKKKYGILEALSNAWHRYSFATWENVSAPRTRGGGYADELDWEEFRSENKARLFQRRAQLFRSLDKKNLVVAHKGGSANLDIDEWRTASEVDVWGFTWVASRHGDAPWMQFQAVDIVRAHSRGKPFWHAEAQAGPLWLQPQVPGRTRDDGRITYPKDVSLWNMISMAGGATGILYPRWRPLLDGPLFGAFGGFGMDGSVTPRAEVAGNVARWANSHPDLWRSHPVKGDIGIVFIPESQNFNLNSSSQYYAESSRGAYQAFFDSNIQPDYVLIDNINDYNVIYVPYPVMLKKETANKLIDYVKNGGRMICEGLPGYFGEGGHVGEIQPNYGLDNLFGAKESYVEFTPDLLENLTLEVFGSKINGRYFLQEYIPERGEIAGSYENGAAAAIENKTGKGKTLLIGTFPGAGYAKYPSSESRKFFSDLLKWGGVEQQTLCSDPNVKIRLHEGEGGKYLWVVNPTRTVREVSLKFADQDKVSRVGNDLWRDKPVVLDNGIIKVTIDERDAAVIPLQ